MGTISQPPSGITLLAGGIGTVIPGATANSVLYIGAGEVLAQDNPDFIYDGTSKLSVPSIALSSLTAGRVPFAGTAGLLGDSANLLYDDTTKQVTIGSGSTTSQGWVLGNSANTVSSMWITGITPGASNYAFRALPSQTAINTIGATDIIYFMGAGTERAKIGGAAGAGFSITAGTAASAVSALSLTQVRNFTTSATTYLDYNITQTATHANDLIYSYRDGATVYSSLTKGGALAVLTSAIIGDNNGTSGKLTIGVGTGQGLFFGNRGSFGATSDGVFTLRDNATTGFSTLQFYTDSNISRTGSGSFTMGTGAAGSTAGSLSLTNITLNTGGTITGPSAVLDVTGSVRASVNVVAAAAGLLGFVTSGGMTAVSDGLFSLKTNAGAAGTGSLNLTNLTASGTVTSGVATFLHATTATLNNGAGAGLGTLTNAPTAGDPAKWIAINDNGTTRYIPTWV